MKKLYKFLRTDLKSDSGENRDWKLNEWRHEDKIDMCNSGFHASKTPLQALEYVAGEILAQVEVRGESEIENDKECWSDMRIMKAYHWKKNDSVELAIFAAEKVIGIYEKKYPNDDRPRKAIETAKKWLAKPTDSAASAADSAASAADSAARAARAAYSAAYSAADSAARAADSAASAARAADSAASKKLVASLNKWFIKKIKTLEPYEAMGDYEV